MSHKPWHKADNDNIPDKIKNWTYETFVPDAVKKVKENQVKTKKVGDKAIKK